MGADVDCDHSARAWFVVGSAVTLSTPMVLKLSEISSCIATQK